MKLIYVASPYSGDVRDNIKFAKEACRFIVESGHAFFAPHLLYPSILNDKIPEERQRGIDMGLAMLSKCDELWAFGVLISDGMRAEIDEAERLGIPVQHFVVFDETRKGPRLRQPGWKKYLRHADDGEPL